MIDFERIQLDIEFANLIKRNCQSGDCEASHTAADDYLCDLLNKLGFHETVEEFHKIKKWYA